MTASTKDYDRDYFDTWYRRPRTRVVSSDSLERKVRLAVSAAEYMLGRRIRTVLDVGCGEGNWYTVLRRMRPGVRYRGIDSSEYAVRRYGRRRNIRLGSFGALASMRLQRGIDLVVSADTMQYVSTRDLERGLSEIRRITGGIAYLDAYTLEDAMEGDREGWIDRPAATYRRLFRRAGLERLGLNCFYNPATLKSVNSFEGLR